jgi:hypothetical protein
VGDLRLLVEAASDAVAHEVAHHRVALGLHDGLDGVADVAEARARTHGLDAAALCLEGRHQQVHGLRRDLAYRDRGGVVPVHAFDDECDVDAQDVALAEHHLAARDAVTDDLVSRRADAAREALVAERRGRHAVPAGELHLQVVEVERAHTGLHLAEDPLEALRGQAPGAPHGRQVLLVLDPDRVGAGRETHRSEVNPSSAATGRNRAAAGTMARLRGPASAAANPEEER